MATTTPLKSIGGQEEESEYIAVVFHKCKIIWISSKGSSSPEEHMEYVWRHFLSKCPAKFIDVMAHSYGGVVTVSWVTHL